MPASSSPNSKGAGVETIGRLNGTRPPALQTKHSRGPDGIPPSGPTCSSGHDSPAEGGISFRVALISSGLRLWDRTEWLYSPLRVPFLKTLGSWPMP